MMNKAELSKQAVVAAMRLRREYGIQLNTAICPYDLAHKMGIKVQFLQIPSLEGMYSPAPKQAIILGSERPAGRKRYTCSHEIGHHVFSHGYRLDELESESSQDSPEEYIAQRFAGALLMPQIAISSAIKKRGWDPSRLEPEYAYRLSREFGVGYSTFLSHLGFTFPEISRSYLDSLKKIKLKEIRKKIIGFEIETDVFVVDKYWSKATLDLEIGDWVITPEDCTFENTKFLEKKEGVRGALKACTQGECGINFNTERDIDCRITKKFFFGLAKYQYLEEEENE